MANTDKLKAVKTPLHEIVEDVSDLKDYVATIGDKTFEHDTMLNTQIDKLERHRLFINNLKYETDMKFIDVDNNIEKLNTKCNIIKVILIIFILMEIISTIFLINNNYSKSYIRDNKYTEKSINKSFTVINKTIIQNQNDKVSNLDTGVDNSRYYLIFSENKNIEVDKNRYDNTKIGDEIIVDVIDVYDEYNNYIGTRMKYE
jgi:hypothetical protein